MAVQTVQSDEPVRLWEQILLSVRDRIASPQAFETWFKPIVPLEVGPRCVQLEVPNPFFVDWIHEHHLSALRLSVRETLGASPEIHFTARPPENAAPAPPTVHAPAPAAPRPNRAWLESQLNPRLTFESFIVGSSNHLPHAACIAVSQKPGTDMNPLFIFGGSGLGKTHLLHAVGHAVRQNRPEARVYYVSAERFTNEMIYAIQHAQTLPFRNKYRTVDVLLIDDIQFLAGKESTQEEFFHTFNTLRDAHKQVVVTADKPPKDIPMLEERLISRFNQGMVADVQQPDLETRIAILRSRSAREGGGVRLPDDVLLLIADRIRNNVRDLEGCLVRLLAVASLSHREISTELAEEVLPHYVNPEPDHLDPERILTVVAERFDVRVEAMCGPRRTRTVSVPRQVAMYLLRQLTTLSLAEIGRAFSGRDHSTVIYACDRVAELIARDKEFAERINSLISTLASG